MAIQDGVGMTADELTRRLAERPRGTAGAAVDATASGSADPADVLAEEVRGLAGGLVAEGGILAR